MATLQYFLVAVLCLSTTYANLPVHLNLNNNFKVDYQVNGQTIDFVITATATGWVAIGFNTRNASMFQGDFMIGSVNNRNESDIGDYYLLDGAPQRSPVRDTLQNWNFINGTEAGGVTKLAARRLLTTNDTSNQDVQLGNRNVFLLWAYNSVNDSLTSMHSAMGSTTINPLSSGGDSVATMGFGTLLVALTASMMKSWV